MAKDSAAFRYADLFAGIGGFHAMLDHAGGRCVYVSEIDREARQTYLRNWVEPLPEARRPVVNTDITMATPDDGPVDVPPHDVLAAGFPCQPFSKSGYQRGMDEARGTLFWNIARILEERTPAVVLLENVRNIAGPRHTHEWDVIIQTLCGRSVTASRPPRQCSRRTSSHRRWAERRRSATGSSSLAPTSGPGMLRRLRYLRRLCVDLCRAGTCMTGMSSGCLTMTQISRTSGSTS